MPLHPAIWSFRRAAQAAQPLTLSMGIVMVGDVTPRLIGTGDVMSIPRLSI